MAIGLDVGTAFLVKSKLSDEGDTEFTQERNCFLQAASTVDTEEFLRENDWSFVQQDGDYYVVGEDAIRLKNTLSLGGDATDIVATRVGALRRPMRHGILNTGGEKLSIAIIQQILRNLLGQPCKNQHLVYCAPAQPIDNPNITVTFHQAIMTGFFMSLGYQVECIPEALAIIFSECPVAEDEEGEHPFSGISISCGAGMVNICMAWKKLPLIMFSIAQSGDWIDQQAANMLDMEVSVLQRFKEKELDLREKNPTDLKKLALTHAYTEMIQGVLKQLSNEFNKLETQIDSPLEIVVAGGTACVPGFIERFREVLSQFSLPFQAKVVRLAEDPFFTVANGCLVKAISNTKKQRAAASPDPEVTELDENADE